MASVTITMRKIVTFETTTDIEINSYQEAKFRDILANRQDALEGLAEHTFAPMIPPDEWKQTGYEIKAVSIKMREPESDLQDDGRNIPNENSEKSTA